MTGSYTRPGLRNNAVGTFDANGEAQFRITNDNSAALWIIRQVSLICSPVRDGVLCTMRPPTGIVDTSYLAGTGDAAFGEPPIYLYSGEYLELSWSNGASGAAAIATYYYDEVIL